MLSSSFGTRLHHIIYTAFLPSSGVLFTVFICTSFFLSSEIHDMNWYPGRSFRFCDPKVKSMHEGAVINLLGDICKVQRNDKLAGGHLFYTGFTIFHRTWQFLWPGSMNYCALICIELVLLSKMHFFMKSKQKKCCL